MFRFNTADGAEYRLWFTRRITLFILGTATHLTQVHLETKHSPDVAKAISEFERETLKGAVKQDGNPGQNQTYEPGSNYPIGADPLLVLDVKCTIAKEVHADKTNEALSIDLTLPGGGNLNMKLAGQTLTGMCMLLDQLREKANWGSPLTIHETAPASDGFTPTLKNIQIH